MSGTLYVVATPIGNLEDITLRALRVLREASVIAAEDTRRSGKLLHHHAIHTPTISFHEHNTKRRMPELLARLNSGRSVALVSDAGTPVISDPGLELIQACLAGGIPVEPIPGASAILTALVGSGFPPQPLTFLGFPPTKAYDRNRWILELSRMDHTVIFFEAPHRIQATLAEMAALLGNRPLSVGRELTKLHQEFLRGTAAELAHRLTSPRGEFTVVVGPGERPEVVNHHPSPASIAAEFGQLTDDGGLTRREAISRLSKRHRIPSREVYAMLEAAKGPLS